VIAGSPRESRMRFHRQGSGVRDKANQPTTKTNL
jgi:hypothetical protein